MQAAARPTPMPYEPMMIGWVTPSSSAHKNIPMAPGRKAIGEVREFKVVPDHLGRGRELVDVTKKKEGTGGKKRTADKEGLVLDLGYLKCIDTCCYCGKWLTALEVTTGEMWQATPEGKLKKDEG